MRVWALLAARCSVNPACSPMHPLRSARRLALRAAYLSYAGLHSAHSVRSAHLTHPLLCCLSTVGCPAAHSQHSRHQDGATARQPDGSDGEGRNVVRVVGRGRAASAAHVDAPAQGVGVCVDTQQRASRGKLCARRGAWDAHTTVC